MCLKCPLYICPIKQQQKKQTIMEAYNGIVLEYKNSKRNNYMSLTDLAQDLKTESLIKVLPTLKELKNQMVIMKEIEIRNEVDEDYFYDLLETCNGI